MKNLKKFENLIESFSIEDVRNKLTPVSNLVKMIELDVDRKLILSQLEQVKESIKYLSQR